MFRKRRTRRPRRKSNLKSAWKRTRKPRKKSALVRQTEQNRKEIKKLKDTREVKKCRNLVARVENNFIGQILYPQKVDNFGLCQDSLDWANASPFGQYLPATNSTAYSPLWVCPTLTFGQGIDSDQRIGDYVTMKSLNIKGTMIGGYALANGGSLADMPQKQTLHMYVVLDTAPPTENVPPPNTNPTFNLNCIPGQTFRYQTQWNNVIGGSNDPRTFKGTWDHLKDGTLLAKNPSGLNTANNRSKDLLNLTYWSQDEGGIGDSQRFKILKHYKYHCDQFDTGPTTQQPGVNVLNPRKSTRDFSETIKGNYKFHFPTNTSKLPDNQCIWLVFVSETPTQRYSIVGGPSQPPNTYVAAPSVALTCSFNYTDA